MAAAENKAIGLRSRLIVLAGPPSKKGGGLLYISGVGSTSLKRNGKGAYWNVVKIRLFGVTIQAVGSTSM